MQNHTPFFKKCLISVMVIFYFYAIPPAFARLAHLSDSQMPVKVNADDMVYDMDKNTVTFLGSVLVTRGEFTMKSSKMVIYMLKKADPNQDKNKSKASNTPQNMPLTGEPKKNTSDEEKTDNSIERIEALNGVTFSYGTQSGSSRSASYNAQTGVLTMRGNPVVREGENLIQGETIRYYMFERRSEVVGTAKKRVEAIFNN